MDIFTIAAATASFVLAIALAVQALRIGWDKVPVTVLVLIVSWSLIGSMWLLQPLLGHSHHLVMAVNLVMTAAVFLLIVRARPIVDALVEARRTARLHSTEYERALGDYERLIAHRLSNPLAVIMGAASTLQSRELSDSTQEELLEAIADSAQRIENISAHPSVQSAEERELRPAPKSDIQHHT